MLWVQVVLQRFEHIIQSDTSYSQNIFDMASYMDNLQKHRLYNAVNFSTKQWTTARAYLKV